MKYVIEGGNFYLKISLVEGETFSFEAEIRLCFRSIHS